MPDVALTVITLDGPRAVTAEVSDGHVLLEPAALVEATGWELKPEGLCRDDVCVPVRDRETVERDGRVDLAGVATALRRPLAVEPIDAALAAVAVLGEAAADRAAAMASAVAAPFDIEGVTGGRVTLDQYAGHKRLLHAWASW